MSDTPRVDAEWGKSYECLASALTEMAMLAFDIERELTAANKRIAELEASAPDAKDASRWRWFRMQDWFDSDLCAVKNPKQAVRPGNDCPSRERLDEMADAAMANETEGTMTTKLFAFIGALALFLWLLRVDCIGPYPFAFAQQQIDCTANWSKK